MPRNSGTDRRRLEFSVDPAGSFACRLNVPVVSIPEEEAAEHFGFRGQLAGLDMPASSEWTRKTLDWHPTHPSLLEDLSDDFYFREALGADSKDTVQNSLPPVPDSRCKNRPIWQVP